MHYDAICADCGEVEIEKPMLAEFPARHSCGSKLTRKFSAPAVVYAAAGFYATDVDHFKKQLGGERFAKFEAKRQAAEKRARAGKLSNYEKVLETI